MAESAVFTDSDVAAIKSGNTPENVDLAAMVAQGMNEMVENGEDPANFGEDPPPEEPEGGEPEDDILEKAHNLGYDESYEGDDKKSPEEFIAYSEEINAEKDRKREDRELRERLDRLEADKTLLAQTDAAGLRNQIAMLENAHREAVDDGDYEQVKAVDEELVKAKYQLSRTSQIVEETPLQSNNRGFDISPEAQQLVDDFESKNPWIHDGNDKDTQHAQFLFSQALNHDRGDDDVVTVEEAIKSIKNGIPGRFKKTNKSRSQAPAAVRGRAASTKNSSQVTERDLSREELNAFKAMKRAGVYNTAAEYYKDMVEGDK